MTELDKIVSYSKYMYQIKLWMAYIMGKYKVIKAAQSAFFNKIITSFMMGTKEKTFAL
jgi:hypothetical protein